MKKDNAVVVWQAPEYTYTEKNPDWFWVVGILSLAIAITAIILGNVLFGVFIIIAAISVSIHAIRRPRIINYALTEKGVLIDKDVYLYNTLESFWVDEDEQKLIIRSRKVFMPYLVLPLLDGDTEDLQNVLIEYLDEEEMQKPFIQKMMDHIGF
jgi:hypothetical protein